MSQQTMGVSAEVRKLVEDGQKQIESGSYREATMFFEQVVVLSADCSHFWERLGTCYREGKLAGQAEYCYRRARAIDANNFDAAFHWGVLKMDMGEWQQADQQFRDAARLDPADTNTLENLDYVSVQMKKNAESKVTPERALRLKLSIAVLPDWKP